MLFTDIWSWNRGGKKTTTTTSWQMQGFWEFEHRENGISEADPVLHCAYGCLQKEAQVLRCLILPSAPPQLPAYPTRPDRIDINSVWIKTLESSYMPTGDVRQGRPAPLCTFFFFARPCVSCLFPQSPSWQILQTDIKHKSNEKHIPSVTLFPALPLRPPCA